MSYWEKFTKLSRFSFVRAADRVQRVVDRGGLYIEQHDAAVIVDQMQSEINHLNSVIQALKGAGIHCASNKEAV